MTSGPIISWQTDGGKVEAVADFIFLGSKITVDGDSNYKIKRQLLPGKRVMTDSISKSPQSIVKALIFPEVMNGYES